MTPTPTLESFEVPALDLSSLSHSESDVPESFYRELVSETETLAQTLVETLPTTHTPAGYVLQFDNATYTDYVRAIESTPHIVVKGLTAAAHMSERIVREHINVPRLYKQATSDVSVSDTPALQVFITQGCQQYLTEPVPVETVAHLYFRMQEEYKAYHAGESFNAEVREFLSLRGFAVESGHSYPGRPNVVVNGTQPVEFTGNAVVAKAIAGKVGDIPKRARQTAPRVADMKNAEPQITTALLLDVHNTTFPNDRIREKKRNRVTRQHPDAIDGVFFSDELSQFATFCNNNISVFDVSPHTPSDEQTTHESLDAWN